MSVEALIFSARRAQQASNYNIGNCSRIFNIVFFFDGVHRYAERDILGDKLSNIPRLHITYPDEIIR